MTDEELIEAFKFYGAAHEKDGITKEMLGDTLEKEGIKVDNADLDLLFNETSDKGGSITFGDFMLMMMPK